MLHFKTHLHPTNKEWLCFIHGAGGSSSIWFKQVKFFQQHFNLLFIDLRGHGKSLDIEPQNKYTVQLIIDDILEVLKNEKIEKAHFVGISLGTILIQELAHQHPKMVDSMVLGGAVCKLDARAQFLLFVAKLFYKFIPYMLIYRLAAFIVLPRKNHALSRYMFIKEASKLNQMEFNKWFKLLSKSNPLLKKLRKVKRDIPTLYIMGDQDHLFLATVKKLLPSYPMSGLEILKSCGHVVNFEKHIPFNELSLKFVQKVVARNNAITF